MGPDGTKWPPQRKLATGYAVAIAVLIIEFSYYVLEFEFY